MYFHAGPGIRINSCFDQIQYICHQFSRHPRVLICICEAIRLANFRSYSFYFCRRRCFGVCCSVCGDLSVAQSPVDDDMQTCSGAGAVAALIELQPHVFTSGRCERRLWTSDVISLFAISSHKYHASRRHLWFYCTNMQFH